MQSQEQRAAVRHQRVVAAPVCRSGNPTLHLEQARPAAAVESNCRRLRLDSSERAREGTTSVATAGLKVARKTTCSFAKTPSDYRRQNRLEMVVVNPICRRAKPGQMNDKEEERRPSRTTTPREGGASPLWVFFPGKMLGALAALRCFLTLSPRAGLFPLRCVVSASPLPWFEPCVGSELCHLPPPTPPTPVFIRFPYGKEQ